MEDMKQHKSDSMGGSYEQYSQPSRGDYFARNDLRGGCGLRILKNLGTATLSQLSMTCPLARNIKGGISCFYNINLIFTFLREI